MIILGITGSIGMGKSTVASMLENMGVPTHSADGAVHEFLAENGAAADAVRLAFPQLGAWPIDRAALAGIVFNNDAAREKLESILHPLVRTAHDAFVEREKIRGTKIVALDIPLLFETGGESRVNYTLVVTAPYWIQRARVMKRPGTTQEKFQAILGRQMPDAEKRKRADFVVHTGFGRPVTRCELKKILGKIKAKI
ncbi:MAG: dephospho-CoA kinase [Alphaproteobacteria bacterium]